jgi:hypothetical protein
VSTDNRTIDTANITTISNPFKATDCTTIKFTNTPTYIETFQATHRITIEPTIPYTVMAANITTNISIGHNQSSQLLTKYILSA